MTEKKIQNQQQSQSQNNQKIDESFLKAENSLEKSNIQKRNEIERCSSTSTTKGKRP